MRNKAAEKAKISGYGSGGCSSPDLTPGLSHEAGHTSLRHPSYSINGILGIHQQQDANANIQSRKREAEGEWNDYVVLIFSYEVLGVKKVYPKIKISIDVWNIHKWLVIIQKDVSFPLNIYTFIKGSMVDSVKKYYLKIEKHLRTEVCSNFFSLFSNDCSLLPKEKVTKL